MENYSDNFENYQYRDIKAYLMIPSNGLTYVVCLEGDKLVLLLLLALFQSN